jgi:anthranilate phosphoribosyltransferase
MALGSLVVSVGKVATGGTGYSSAQLFPALKAMAAKTGLSLLEFSNQAVTVSRGTYTPKAVCI